MTSRQVAGHALKHEGAPYEVVDDRPRRLFSTRVGMALCSCGTLSPVLQSGGQRKRWHREHKAKVAT